MDFGLPAFWTQLQSGAAMEAPTLVEVDDLDGVPGTDRVSDIVRGLGEPGDPGNAVALAWATA